MKHPTTITIAVGGIAALVLAACENPADKTADATVKEAVQADPATTAGSRFVFSESSTIGFVGSKVTGSHQGGFKSFTGHFLVDGDAVTGGQITIDMSSTWSDNDKLTDHLKSADFFDVPSHPESTFAVTGVEKTGDNAYSISGNLKLHGVEKNITFPATASKDGETVVVEATFDINRKDFKIDYPGKADDLIRDEVVIEFKLTAEPESASEA